ncbi:AAA family ATPase [Sunxiuqinia rutila]|uniref:AAA family ATPase n=1 Tax=Sunxiuqinia rutila TaxID=1397841 RepID=UPI003D359CFC
MKLNKFIGTNIHGYLNYEIDFREDITFLIGINGTGKTSVLKLILGLISPSYNYLNQIEFDEVVLESTDSVPIKLSAIKDSNTIKILLSINGEDTDGILTKYNINMPDSSLSRDEHREKLNTYKQLFEEEEVYDKIKKLATPLFLGIDRRVYEGHNIDRNRNSFMLRKKMSQFALNDPLNVSLMDVQGLLYDYYRIIAGKQPTINEKFKNKILAQTFEFIENQDVKLLNDFKELKKKRQDTLTAIENLNVGDFEEKIKLFFDKMENVLREIQDVEKQDKSKAVVEERIEVFQKWFTNQPQLKRINEIIMFSQSYQNEIDALFEPVNKLKSLINHFFLESKKNIDIDERGDISIVFKNGNTVEPYQLSSGEKQIISMLAHLVFFQLRYEKDGGIFIIDEPELSLHLAWQEIFVKSLMKASPETQFILATHSPAIISEFGGSYCEDLLKLN